jgi:hypothetical protein
LPAHASLNRHWKLVVSALKPLEMMPKVPNTATQMLWRSVVTDCCCGRIAAWDAGRDACCSCCSSIVHAATHTLRSRRSNTEIWLCGRLKRGTCGGVTGEFLPPLAVQRE